MAFELDSKLYRVSIGKERNFIFCCANDTEDLIRFLVSKYDPNQIYGAKEISSDGSLMPVSVVTNPLFLELCSKRGEDDKPSKVPLNKLIDDATARITSPETNFNSTEHNHIR